MKPSLHRIGILLAIAVAGLVARKAMTTTPPVALPLDAVETPSLILDDRSPGATPPAQVGPLVDGVLGLGHPGTLLIDPAESRQFASLPLRRVEGDLQAASPSSSR